MTIVEEIMQQMKGLSKPRRDFFSDLWDAQAACVGRVTMENLSRFGAGSARRLARHSRMAFDFVSLNLLSLTVANVISHDLVLAIDCTFLPKAGKHTFGLAKFYNSCNSRAERGLEACVLSLVDLQEHTAYTLDARQTPPKSADDETRNDFYLQTIRKAQPHFNKLTQCVVGDGAFANTKFIQGLTEMNLTLVSKLPCNANLRYLYDGLRTGKRGRPQQYDGKVRFDDLSKMTAFTMPGEEFKGYTAVVNHPHFKINIKVVVLVFERKGKRQYKILFSTDTEMSAEKIVKIYRARFQIEFVFRDAKQHTGLGHAQVRDEAGQHFWLNAALTGLNMMRLEERQMNHATSGRVTSIRSLKRIKHNEMLLAAFCETLGLNVVATKSHPQISQLLSFGAVQPLAA